MNKSIQRIFSGVRKEAAPCFAGGFLARRQFQTMRAVVFDGEKAVVDQNRQVPTLTDDSVLVRPVAVALNPTDWKHVKFGRARAGCIVGCDYAGVVEAVGAAVDKWQPGDRIFGCTHGANFVNPDDGAFAELAVVNSDLQMRIPDDMSFEQAATLGLGTITVGQGLYQQALKLALPESKKAKDKNDYVLIYGGGTATAALGIQFARLSGYSVVTACLPESFEYVKSLGAEFAIDYNDRDVGAKLRDYTQNRLKYAWDTIGIDSSAQICADALSSSGDLALAYGSTNPTKCPRPDVRSVSTIMYTVFGKPFKFGAMELPAVPEDFEFGKMFYGLTEELVKKVLLKPHVYRVGANGLEGVLQGLQDLEDGKVQGEKLVHLVGN